MKQSFRHAQVAMCDSQDAHANARVASGSFRAAGPASYAFRIQSLGDKPVVAPAPARLRHPSSTRQRVARGGSLSMGRMRAAAPAPLPLPLPVEVPVVRTPAMPSGNFAAAPVDAWSRAPAEDDSEVGSRSPLQLAMASTIPAPLTGDDALAFALPRHTPGVRAWSIAALLTVVSSVLFSSGASSAQLASSAQGKATHAPSWAAESELLAPAPVAAAPKPVRAAFHAPVLTDRDVPMLLRRAASAVKEGRDDRARDLYLAAARLDASSSEALGGLGEVARRAGNLDEAVTSFERALDVNDRFFPAALALADIAWDRGDVEMAALRYRDIAESFPGELLPQRVTERAAPSEE